MNTILKQRNFLTKKEFELTDKSLKVSISKPFSFLEDEFTFEQINYKLRREKKPKVSSLIISIILSVFLIVALVSHFSEKNGSGINDIYFYLILLLISTFITYATFKNVINLALFDNRYLSFFANSPNRKTVENFLDLIKIEQKKYLLSRYAKADPYLNTEQLSNNLKWLWDKKVINDIELNELRSQLIGNRYDENRSVGFKINPKDN
jgi:hypothetical protein